LRILLLGLNYSPELTGVGKYSGEMMEWLAERGHEVRVVTTPPYYPAWRVGGGYRWWQYSASTSPAGARIYRCPLWVPQRPNGVNRILHLASFAISSLPLMLALTVWRPDIILTVEPALFCAPAALMAAFVCGCPALLHIQDFEVDAAFDLKLLPPGGLVHQIASAYERVMMRGFTGISTISTAMLKRLEEKGIRSDCASVFPNWVDVDEVQPAETDAPNAIRRKLGIGDDKVVLLYSGNLGIKQGLEILPQLARELRSESSLHLVICGDGNYRPHLERMTAGLSNVSLLSLQPKTQFNELLNAANIHLLPQRCDAADLVMPSKLTGMLASGRPVVAMAAAGSPVADAVTDRGMVVPPGDLNALREAVLLLARNAAQREELGREARRYAVEYLGREEVLRRFEAGMLNLLETHQALAVSEQR
jgi:colanic acid biosynthesis glycosyl transferase WcaI